MVLFLKHSRETIVPLLPLPAFLLTRLLSRRAISLLSVTFTLVGLDEVAGIFIDTCVSAPKT